MATGGMGDTLTGIIGSLVGQKLDPYDAACLGVYLHGTAGDIAADSVGGAGLMDAKEAVSCRLVRQLMQGLRKAGYVMTSPLAPLKMLPQQITSLKKGEKNFLNTSWLPHSIPLCLSGSPTPAKSSTA